MAIDFFKKIDFVNSTDGDARTPYITYNMFKIIAPTYVYIMFISKSNLVMDLRLDP